MKLAACVGGRFQRGTVQAITQRWRSESNLATAGDDLIEVVLWPAVEQGLLEEIPSDPFANEQVDTEYKFTHDKVRSCGRQCGPVHFLFMIASNRELM